mgnify:CR=1 FL=1
MTTTTGAATMSAAEVLAEMDGLYRSLHDGRFYDDYDAAAQQLGRLRDARAAVSAMAEREAALVAERDALRAEVEALKISLATSQDAYKLSGKFVEAMANEMRDAGCEVDGTKVRNLRAEALRAHITAIAEAEKERKSARDAFYAADRACGETDDEIDRCVAATKALNDAIDAARAEASDG